LENLAEKFARASLKGISSLKVKKEAENHAKSSVKVLSKRVSSLKVKVLNQLREFLQRGYFQSKILSF